MDALLAGEHRDLSGLVGAAPVADVGGADGDCAFFLESLGYTAQLVDNPSTNFNGLRGARMLKEALGSSVEITERDLDDQFALPAVQYGLVLFLGLLYHLRNPYYILERLSRQTTYCLMSTKVARFSPSGVDLGDIPVAYLLDERELNNDPTNYWVFSHSGLSRLLSRTGWQICSQIYVGNTPSCDWSVLEHKRFRSDPVNRANDERAFLLLRSNHSREGRMEG